MNSVPHNLNTDKSRFTKKGMFMYMKLIAAFFINIISLLLTYLICKNYFFVLTLGILSSLLAYHFVFKQLNFKIDIKLLKPLYILLYELSICLSLFLTCDYLNLSNGRYSISFFM